MLRLRRGSGAQGDLSGPGTGSRPRGPGVVSYWSALIRSAPLGVLILCAVLFFLGAGLVLGGLYLAFARRDTGWVAWAMALCTGPVAIYLALHLLRLTSWAWLALVTLVGLLFVSSAVRAFGSPETRVSPMVEMAVEVLCLVYLTRPSVRRSFGTA